MAMFLSRIKKALNLGTKSITQNGTYNASSDGYNGYSSVEVNVAGVTPSPITPSNSSPAQMTANTPVTPTANGYAIASYSNVTPSNNSPATLNSYNPVIPLGNGYAIENYSNVTPTSSPSLQQSGFIKLNGNAYVVNNMNNIHPMSIPQNIYSTNTYYCEADGVVVDEITSITPSNSTPVALSANTPVNPTASGYAISSYSSKTPSDSSPASVSSGAIIKASASGYLYSSSGLKDVPTYFSGISATTNNSSGTNSVSVTSGKKYLLVAIRVSTGSASDCSITSGATVNKTYVNNTSFSGGKAKLYVVMCTATSSTITVAGTNNIISVLPLN